MPKLAQIKRRLEKLEKADDHILSPEAKQDVRTLDNGSVEIWYGDKVMARLAQREMWDVL